MRGTSGRVAKLIGIGIKAILAGSILSGPGLAQAVTPRGGDPVPVLEMEASSFGFEEGDSIGVNDCESFQVALENNGSAAATSISAVLSSSTPGVTVVQDYTEYPDISDGEFAEQNIRFHVATSSELKCGQEIQFTLNVDTAEGKFVIPVTQQIGSEGEWDTYYSSGSVGIPDDVPTEAVSGISVTDFPAFLGKVAVRLHVTHGEVGELDLYLESPGGTRIQLAPARGPVGINYGQNCPSWENPIAEFADDATSSILEATGVNIVGPWRPVEPLSTFVGMSAEEVNGTWNLIAIDSTNNESGGLLGCWELIIREAYCPEGNGTCGPAAVSIGDATINEPDGSGTAEMDFAVQIPFPISHDVTVDYSFSDISAAQGTDYTASPGTLTIPSGETSGTLVVTVNADDIYEVQEQFEIQLSNASGLPLSDSTGLGTINDDNVLQLIKTASPSVIPIGGNSTFTLTLSKTGQSNSGDLTLIDELPAGLTYVSHESTTATCDEASGVITCQIPSQETSPVGISTDSFHRLPESPVPLTCVAVDPSTGILYAIENEGDRFYRYLPGSETWEQIGESPFNSGNNGGGCVLNGSFYATFTSYDGMAIYNIATGTWQTEFGAPGTGTTGTDGNSLYAAVGSNLYRYDPGIGWSFISSTDADFQPWGVLDHLDGYLYICEGNGNNGLWRYDISEDEWLQLESAPNGLVLGGAIDPVNRKLYAWGNYEQNFVYIYDIDSNTWEEVDFSDNFDDDFRDGGMAYTTLPTPRIYMVVGESGTNFGMLGGGEALAVVNIAVTGDEVGNYINTALLENAGEGELLHVESSGTLVVRPITADLAIEKKAARPTVLIDEPVTFTITVTNQGPEQATFVTITDAVPDGMVIHSVSSNLADCNTNGSTVTCTVDALGEVPVDWVALESSPVPLTGFAGDPETGILYAYSEFGDRFFQYDPANPGWTELSNGPFGLDGNAGAVVIDGIYYIHPASDIELPLEIASRGIGGGPFGYYMGQYDIALAKWSYDYSPIEDGTATVGTDGESIYFAKYDIFVRWSPTLGLEYLASPPIEISGYGAIAYYNGYLYITEGNGYIGFLRYHIASDSWVELENAPSEDGGEESGPVQGGTIDPESGLFFTTGGYGGSSLMTYSIGADAWSKSNIPIFPAGSIDDNGLVYVGGPNPRVYVIQGEEGEKFGAFTPRPQIIAAKIDVVASASVPGVYTNEAVTSGTEFDNNTGNNSASVTVIVREPLAEVTIRKEASVETALEDDVVSFTLTINTLGPETPSEIIVTDALPEGLEFQSVESDKADCGFDGTTITCTITEILVSSSNIEDLVYTTLDDSPDPITAVAADPELGVIWAMYVDGSDVFRYTPEEDDWDYLETFDSPEIFDTSTGLMVNGTYFVVRPFDDDIYGLNTDTLEWEEHDLGDLNVSAMAATDGTWIYYVYYDEEYDEDDIWEGGEFSGAIARFARYNPETSEQEELEYPPFFVYPSGGPVAYFNGRIYMTAGDEQEEFATYDIANNIWIQLADAQIGEAEPIHGGTFDPETGILYAYGDYGGDTLFRYHAFTDTWEGAELDENLTDELDDGGIAYLNSGGMRRIYLSSGDNGDEWSAIELGSSNETTITITAIISGSGEVTNTAQAESDLFDTNINNNVSSATITVVGDCNDNLIPDNIDIENETSEDCNGNLIPDECELENPVLDCNGNGVLDECELGVTEFIPTTKSVFVETLEDTEVVVPLNGFDPTGSTVTVIIKSLPTSGTLYQSEGGLRGAPITTVPTEVTNEAFEVIFVPAPGEFGFKYGYFDFVARNCVQESAAREAYVDVNFVPDTPMVVDVELTTPLEEGSTATLTGRIEDDDPLDTFTLEVNWGDNTTSEVLEFGTDATTFSVSRFFADDDPTVTPSDDFGISLLLTDRTGDSSTTETTLTVSNVTPEVVIPTYSASIIEGDQASIQVEITDASEQDTFTLTINWGEGDDEVVELAPGSNSYLALHNYNDDNPTSTDSDIYDVTIEVADDDSGTTTSAVEIVVNNSPPVVSEVAFDSNINEGETASLSGTISDASALDTFSVTVDWGDGSTSETFVYPAGSTFFTETHLYADSGEFTASVVITDDDTGDDNTTAAITVANVAPAITFINAPDSVEELEPLNLLVNFEDPGQEGTFNVEVNWGDGSTSETSVASSFELNIPHRYLDDNPTGTPSDDHVISVLITDPDGGQAFATVTTTVFNGDPELENLTVTSPTTETAVVRLTADLVDPSDDIAAATRGVPVTTMDTFTLVLNWGDGTIENHELAAGTRSIDFTHQFEDDNPSNTPSDTYVMSYTLTDDDGGSDEGGTNITVDNVPPQIDNLAVEAGLLNEETTLTMDIVDPSPNDTFEVHVDWGDSTSDNFSLPAGTTTFSANHTYASSGAFAVEVTVTDDDTGSDSESTTANITSRPPEILNLALISPINENDSTTVTGEVVDADLEDTFTVTINWGDGSPLQVFEPEEGSTTFSLTHQYLDDDPTATPFDISVISIIATDSSNATDEETTEVLINNVAPELSNVGVGSPIAQGGTATLSADIFDPGTSDTFSLLVEWGDGSTPETILLPAGTTSLSGITHQYDNHGTFAIAFELTDDDGGSDVGEASVTVENAAPVLSGIGIISPIVEDGWTTLSGSITDAGGADPLTLEINWADGSPVETIDLSAGTTIFNVGHQYLDDNPSGTGSDSYAVSVTVTDSGNNSDTDSASVTVNNIAPQLSQVTVTSVINENGTVSLSGVISDPGTLDTFTVSVDWGDGSGSQLINLAAGSNEFTADHQYLDDDPTATPSDNYAITVQVTDDDGGSDSSGTSVQVNNVAPQLSSITASATPEGEATLSAVISDPGTLDTFTATINWGDGSSADVVNLPAGSTSLNGTHSYAEPGEYTIIITLTDDDTGSVTETATVIVVSQDVMDLSIQKTSGEAVDGCGVEYTITVANLGTIAATNVTVVDTMPDNVTVVSVTPDVCENNAGTLVCDLGTLASGTSATLVITGIPTGTGPITNVATVTASEADSDTANNTVTHSTTVTPRESGPDLTGSFGNVVIKCRQTRRGVSCSIQARMFGSNQGDVKSPRCIGRLYISDDAQLDPSDWILTRRYDRLREGQTKKVTLRATPPPAVDLNGKYLIWVVDDGNLVDESCESNNIIVYGPLP